MTTYYAHAVTGDVQTREDWEADIKHFYAPGPVEESFDDSVANGWLIEVTEEDEE